MRFQEEHHPRRCHPLSSRRPDGLAPARDQLAADAEEDLETAQTTYQSAVADQTAIQAQKQAAPDSVGTEAFYEIRNRRMKRAYERRL